MFLSFIPAWFACCLLYGSSSKQTYFKKSLPSFSSKITAAILMALMLAILLQHLPTVSALISALSLICCFLPLVTLIAAYKKQYLYLTSGLIGVFAFTSLLFGWLGVNV